MSKITAEHLPRSAYASVDGRSTRAQSREPSPPIWSHRSCPSARLHQCRVVDDDLGRFGGGTARPGFERLITTNCGGSVGVVLAIDASRLAPATGIR
jgi:hypothetical protein